jgi:hypothetical protein
MSDKQSTIENDGNDHTSLTRLLETFDASEVQRLEEEKSNPKPLGKYRIYDRGRLLDRDYEHMDKAALAILRLLRWYRVEVPVRATPVISSLVIMQPGEPDVTVADYFLYSDGAIIRLDEATQDRLTIDKRLPGEVPHETSN